MLDGSAIHNKLKYLGLVDKPTSSSSAYKMNKIYPSNLDFDHKYKYLVFDDDLRVDQHKTKPNLNSNDMYLSKDYNSNYKPQIRDFPSTVYDNRENSYYMPTNSKKYGKTMNFCSPQEYQVYYFPTSKPIVQYPRHTTEQFYRRKPVKQYPREEVPYWYTRYPKPVRVVEREPFYPMNDYCYRNTNNYHVNNTHIDPYISEHRSRYFQTDDNMYHSYDHYHDLDLEPRPHSSITRPCSPVYSRNSSYNKTNLDTSESLLEKKIRDYVWNPHKDRVSKYASNYEKSPYYSDFKLIPNKYQENEIFRKSLPLVLDSRLQNKKYETLQDNSYEQSLAVMSPEKNICHQKIDENSQLQKDNDSFSEYASYKKKNESPINFTKRISFDLDNENIELPSRKTSIGQKCTNANAITKERKLSLGRRESNVKLNDKCQTPVLSNDDYSTSISKQRVFSNDSNGSSRRPSLSKQEKLASIGNSFESDKYSNSKNNFEENYSLEKNAHIFNSHVEKPYYDHNNDIPHFPQTQDEKNNDVFDNIPNEDTNRYLRRDSNVSSIRKLSGTSEKSNVGNINQVENTSIKRDDFSKRRESYRDERKLKQENIPNSRKNSSNIDKQYNYKIDEKKIPKKYAKSPKKNQNNVYDVNKTNTYNINQQETDKLKQFIINDNSVNEKMNLNTETNINSITQDNSDMETNLKEQEPSQTVIDDEFLNNSNYYQDHPNNDTIEHTTHAYEMQPENVANDKSYYQDETADSNKEAIADSGVEPIEHQEFVDENNVHDDYYYQNPIGDTKENPSENQYENSNSQDNNVEKQANDDYYYQNYSNNDSKEQPENQHVDQSDSQEYVTEHPVEQDDYYYREHSQEETSKSQQGNQQYVDSNYRENRIDQQPHTNDDYYYQDYTNAGSIEPQGDQYVEPGHQGEYAADQIDHDDYYYQSRPNEVTNDNQDQQHYAEPENQGNYNDGQQDNYYYPDSSNVNAQRHPSDVYDEHAQQGNYVDDQQTNDDYYYQKPSEGYDESVSKEQYDGYTSNQNEGNQNSYYPDNYDAQLNYDDNHYQTQQAEYTEQYDQNPNNENYGYPDQSDGNQFTGQNANEQSKQ